MPKARHTKRKAVVRSGEIVAECLIGCTCSLAPEKVKGDKSSGEKPWRNCGHFQGTFRDREGQWVLCAFQRWAA